MGGVPLDEYRCSDCGSVFDRLVPRTDGADPAECPVCLAPTGQRVISLVAATVRGSDGGAACCGGGGCSC